MIRDCVFVRCCSMKLGAEKLSNCVILFLMIRPAGVAARVMRVTTEKVLPDFTDDPSTFFRLMWKE